MTHLDKQNNSNTFSGFESLQVQSELDCLRTVAIKYNVQSYLEIGAGCGDTFHAIMSSLPYGSLGVAVDIDQSGAEYLRKASQDLRENYKQKVFNFHGKSQDDVMIKNVQQLGPYDLVFIDGSVLMENLITDWVNYSCVGKMIAFSGIAGAKHKKDIAHDTPLVWEALKYRYPSEEFINSETGIGIILKDVK